MYPESRLPCTRTLGPWSCFVGLVRSWPRSGVRCVIAGEERTRPTEADAPDPQAPHADDGARHGGVKANINGQEPEDHRAAHDDAEQPGPFAHDSNRPAGEQVYDNCAGGGGDDTDQNG